MHSPDDDQRQKTPDDRNGGAAGSGGARGAAGGAAKIAWLMPVLTRPQRLSAIALTVFAYWLVCFAPYNWVAPA